MWPCRFNARKFGELAIKSVYDDRKGVSVQFPRACGDVW